MMRILVIFLVIAAASFAFAVNAASESATVSAEVPGDQPIQESPVIFTGSRFFFLSTPVSPLFPPESIDTVYPDTIPDGWTVYRPTVDDLYPPAVFESDTLRRDIGWQDTTPSVTDQWSVAGVLLLVLAGIKYLIKLLFAVFRVFS